MDIKSLILAKIQKKQQIKASEIIKETGFSRTYINKTLQTLRDEGQIILLGDTNRAIYVLAQKDVLERAKRQILNFSKIIENKNLVEDAILDEIKTKTGIFLILPQNVGTIVAHAFLEMLNNAIEHSQSEKIKIEMRIIPGAKILSFSIIDAGVGIFNNIKKKMNLPSDIAAIQHLLKGKQTTDPSRHSGQGIFFTSKMADAFSIESGRKQIRFLNLIGDTFIEDSGETTGTEINFVLNTESKKTLKEIFDIYTDHDTFEFSKTKISVKLYTIGVELLSRSEARRIMAGLDEFNDITLDFKNVETVGQGFADEIWRVWQNQYPDKKIEYINANENVEAMIKMAINY